jgi:DNA polymerase-3 subunit delta'
MSNWGIPGNETAADRIRDAASRGALSHALLFTGPGDRDAAARFAAAALECTAESGQPCGVCDACRKVREEIHPDVCTVRDDAHKTTAVDVVRAARSDVYIRPNEGARKVYIFPDCGALTEQDQNVLLKIVEEGPPYAAFIFCAENSSAVLPTLRSRCVELKLRPTGDAAAEISEISEHCEKICRAAAKKKRGGLTEALIGLEREKLTRDELQTLLEETRGVFLAALTARYGQKIPEKYGKTVPELAKTLTKMQIMRTIEILQKYRQECLYNVSPGQVLGALAVELEGIL